MKNIYIPIVLLLLLWTISSCKKDFLEITPKGNLIAEKTHDYDLLLNNLDLLNIQTDAQVAMGDEMAAYDPYFSAAPLRTQRLFRYEADIYEPEQNATEMTVPMRNIYVYNKIIEEILDSDGGTDAEKKSLRAEAMAGRAWTYFLLINYYGKPYSSSSATDPGYPIVTSADVTETKFTRASVKDVYDFIVNDLLTAIPDLPAATGHRLRMSRAAAKAILGKVYLSMGQYQDALTQLDGALSDLANSTIPTALYNYNQTFGTGGSFLPLGLFGPRYPAVPDNTENIYSKQYINPWAFTSSELPVTAETVALYGSSDQRLKFFVSAPYGTGTPYANGMMRRRGPIGVQFGVVVPDIWLMRAECRARLNDIAGAEADLEWLRQHRMPAADAEIPDAVLASQELTVRFVLDERIREFAAQGPRWFDMRRLSVDPLYNDHVRYTHRLYNETGLVDQFTLDPKRLVMRFPFKVINQNPGMQNNE